MRLCHQSVRMHTKWEQTDGEYLQQTICFGVEWKLLSTVGNPFVGIELISHRFFGYCSTKERREKKKTNATKRRENNAQCINIYNIENENDNHYNLPNVSDCQRVSFWSRTAFETLNCSLESSFASIQNCATLFIFKTWHCLNANKEDEKKNIPNRNVQIEWNKNPEHICALHENVSYQQATTNPNECFCLLLSIQSAWFLRTPHKYFHQLYSTKNEKGESGNKLLYVKSLKLSRCTVNSGRIMLSKMLNKIEFWSAANSK